MVLAAAAPLCAPAEGGIDSSASRSGKGILVLQTGSDWCVSGEKVRKVFENPAFAKAVGPKYVLAVHDEMENPTDEVKKANEAAAGILIRTKRFPAITCYAPGKKPRVFAQIENVPQDVTPETLAKAVAKVSAKKDKAEALFKSAASKKGEAAADMYGEGFDLLASMMGPFHFRELTDGKWAWSEEWGKLSALDEGDKFGWLRHFAMDEYGCVNLVDKVTSERKKAEGNNAQPVEAANLVESLKRVPQKHFTANQRQCVKIMEYALTGKTDRRLSPQEKKLLREAFELGRETFWGQYAMGRLMMDGEKIESKGLYRAKPRERPSGGMGASRTPFPLERARQAVSALKPAAGMSEEQKLAVAQYAVLRLIGEKGWGELVSRPGSSQFVKAFMADRKWLEDFAWSGTFPANSSDAWCAAGSGPGDGARAALALESLIYQDGGRWTPFANGKYADNAGRRFMTALAITYPDRDEAWLADVLDAYRATALAGRLHKSAYSQPVWLWRFAVHQGHGTASVDNMAAQQRHLDTFVNLPFREYGGTCWMINYRTFNCFGDSVQGPLYYKPWSTAGEWPKRRYSQIVGGVCGELSKFGSATANAHGLPATTAGQPAHCAYTRRLPDGSWRVDYSVTGHSQMHMCFWNRHPWQYSDAIEGTYAADREKRLSADRLLALAALAEERKAPADEIEKFFRQACLASRTHYGAWLDYGGWVSRSGASLDTMHVWARGCARGMKTGRQPLWDILTPYFERLAKERGVQALADGLVEFAPLLRQSERKIQEEADFGEMLKKWAAPIGGDASLLVPVFKAMLAAQYDTPNYFSQTLGWGGDAMMGDQGASALFVKTVGDVMSEKAAGGGSAKLDFAPLILAASRAGNFDSFRQIAALQDRLDPYKGGGKPHPPSDFGGDLMSSEGMLSTSSTSQWDHPENYARGIDATPVSGNIFHTGREKAPWAMVTLRGPVDVRGVLVENNGAGQNRHRQVPIEVELSEDGETWRNVYRSEEVRPVYRVDLRSAPVRAKYVRVRRTPGAKDEFFHLNKILVYGRKLY